MPKVYATEKNLKVAAFMAPALNVMNKLFMPFSFLLISGTNLIDKRIKNNVQNVSIDELNP
jgi:CBS domain containing-hemolysin-like protein